MSTLSFNPDDLTIGDLEDFEDIVGTSFDEAFKAVPVRDDEGNVEKDDKGRPVKSVKVNAKTLKALVYIIYRANDPGFTLDDARNVKVTSLNILGGDEDPEAESVASAN